VNQAEELTLDDWETLTTRATGRGGVMPFAQIYGDCNPGPATHWILSRPTLRLLYSHHEDNPTLYTDAGQLTEQGKRTLAVLDALTGTRYQRLRLGKWVGAEGMVYEEWSREKHLVDLAQLREWGVITDDPTLTLNRNVVKRVIGSVDWGFTNPSVIQVWAVDGDGRVYLVWEFYHSQVLIGDLIHTMQNIQARFGVEYFLGDPSEPAYIRQSRTAGIHMREARNDVAPGIQAVQARLPNAADGRPRLYVLRDCRANAPDPALVEKHKPTSTVEEFDGYIWATTRTSDTVKEEPRKEDDHGMDAARYLCYELAIARSRKVYGIS
jgi:phage terminase large subunit